MLSLSASKLVRSLHKKKYRFQHGLFIAEGEKIVGELLRADRRAWPVARIFASEEWCTAQGAICRQAGIPLDRVEAEEMKKISTLVTPPGVLALVRIPEIQNDLSALAGETLLGFESISDPGNLGTIIRTADWFGISHIICTPGSTDIWSPKVVQASMGAIFRVNIHFLGFDTLLENAAFRDKPVYGTFLEGENLFEATIPPAPLIIFGNESHGLSEQITGALKGRLTIPSYAAGSAGSESLNIASSVAVICAELARRQTEAIRNGNSA